MNKSVQQRSYDRYTALFNKACSSVLFLVISILVSALSVGNVINLFNVISRGDILSILFELLPALFMTLTSIGLWILYASALKNNISGDTFGLVKCFPKYDQVIKTILAVILIIAIVGLLVGLYSIKAEFDEAIEDGEDSTEEIKSLIYDGLNDALGDEAIPQEIVDLINEFVDKIDYYLTTGLIIITVICAIVIIFLIFELIRCSILVKLINSAGNMYKTGHMVSPPYMFFFVLNYIFAVICIVGSIGTSKLLGFDWIMFITGVLQALIGVIVMINRKELKEIYANWKAEIGMVNSTVAFNNEPSYVQNNNYVAPQQSAPQVPVQQPEPIVDQQAPVNSSDVNNSAE